MTNNTQLPAEVERQIEQRAHDAASSLYSPNNYNEFTSYQAGYTKCATEYATKLHQERQENAELKRWKDEAQELLNPILEYGQSKEAGIGLGESITEVVLERCKRYEQEQQDLKKAKRLLNRCYNNFIGAAEMAENNIDKRLMTEIKTFLDGTK